MTRDEALKTLNLPASPSKANMEDAYRRLVRRYPPEFHPEKFREVDEAYRFLTSLPYLIDSLLSADIQPREPAKDLLFASPPAPSEGEIEEALRVMRREFLLAYISTVR